MAITFGTQLEVDANGGEVMAVVGMTATTAIHVYKDVPSGSLDGRVLTLSGTTLSAGAALTIQTTGGSGPNSNNVKLTRLTDTTALVYWYNVPLSSTHAAILTVSGTTLSAGAILNLTDDPKTNNSGIDTLDSTHVILAYSESVSGDGKAVVLSISGTTITENALFTFETPVADTKNVRVVGLSSTKAVAIWADADNSDRPTGEVLDIAGTTITGNADTQLVATTVSNNTRAIQVAGLSTTSLIVCFMNSADSLMDALIVTESGGTLTPGASTNIEDGTNFYYELSISGTTITIDDSEIGSHNGGRSVTAMSATKAIMASDSFISSFDATNAVAVWEETAEAIPVLLSTTLGLAPMTKPADVDAAGSFIYVALLDGGSPILTKISTALSADGTTVFNPGAGTNIGVECGRFNSDVVWVAGAFDGTNVIEKSEDGGSTFTVKDNATIGNVRAFVMGPDSDDKILLFDETNGDILETKDDGGTWTSINASVTPEVNAIARLGKNVEESVFGNDGGVSNSINYSVNSGDDLEDYQTGVYPNANATRVIVN